MQLDQVSFAILLAWRLRRAGALEDFDPYPMVLRAAGFLIAKGPPRRRNAGRRTAAIRPRRWRPISRR